MPGNRPRAKDAFVLVSSSRKSGDNWSSEKDADMKLRMHCFKILANGDIAYISMAENWVRIDVNKALHFHSTTIDFKTLSLWPTEGKGKNS